MTQYNIYGEYDIIIKLIVRDFSDNYDLYYYDKNYNSYTKTSGDSLISIFPPNVIILKNADKEVNFAFDDIDKLQIFETLKNAAIYRTEDFKSSLIKDFLFLKGV